MHLTAWAAAAEAVESYERALAINPGYAEVHLNLGMLATTQGRHEEAAESLRRAVEIKPDFAQAHRALGVVLSAPRASSMRRRQAFAALCPSSPNPPIFFTTLAMILLSLGKSPEALQLIVPALERAPTWTTKIAFA